MRKALYFEWNFSLGGHSLTDAWVYCKCGTRYDARLSSCTKCMEPNPYMGKRMNIGRVGGAAVAAVAIFFAIVLVLPQFTPALERDPLDAVMNIMEPQLEKPKTVPKEELVQQALAAINSDRANFGLPPVSLSNNLAAQAHAEDVFRTKQISHWQSNGEKPYMTYTKFDGTGSVQQNVAISGFSAEQYDKCRLALSFCERVDPEAAIKQLQSDMVYDDEECCNNGHRNNILDPHHTHVSIGIVYDQYYLAFVQNFENNYGLKTSLTGNTVSIAGPLPKGAELDSITVYYDEMPGFFTYEANKKRAAYDGGELVAAVFKPLGPGFSYLQPEDHLVIEADSWTAGGRVDTSFSLAEVVEKDGVYTIYAMLEDGEGNQFSATSYSVFVEK